MDTIRDRADWPTRPRGRAIQTQVHIPLRFADGYEAWPRRSPSTAWPTAPSTSRWSWATPRPRPLPLVRLHSECLTGDVFGSARCDCGPQLREAVERIAPRRRPALPAAGRPRHRPVQQARRLRPPGRRASTPTRRTWPSASRRTRATTRPPPRCSPRSGSRDWTCSPTTPTRRGSCAGLGVSVPQRPTGVFATAATCATCTPRSSTPATPSCSLSGRTWPWPRADRESSSPDLHRGGGVDEHLRGLSGLPRGVVRARDGGRRLRPFGEDRQLRRQ